MATLNGESQTTEKQESESDSPETRASDSQTPSVRATVSETGQLPGGVKASPVARRMAEQNGLDLTAITGSGPGGRIIKNDIEAFLAAPPPAVSEQPSAVSASQTPFFSPVGPPPSDEIVPITKLRQAIGRRLVEAKQQLPHFYVTQEYDVAPLMALRKQVNSMLDGSGEKLSVNDFIVKAVALALRQYPNLNASLVGTDVVQHGQVNIGVAVSVPGGLLTVVVKDADRKSLAPDFAGDKRDGGARS